MGTEAQPGKIACPHCQALIKAPALPPGSPVNCPKCGQEFKLGHLSAAVVRVSRPNAQSQRPDVGGSKSETTGPRLPAPPPPPTNLPVPPPPPQRPGHSQSAARNPQSPPSVSQSSPTDLQTANRKPTKPDNLVDPNLLPPPPLKQKPKPKEVAVVCHLCGTRVYAPIEKIGQEIKCPDCHTRNVVPPLPEDAAKKSRGPTLEGTEEFGMSEVVERPKYRPLVRERGEYDTLSALDPAAIEHRSTVPRQQPRRAEATVQRADPGEDEEISIAPPVEVVEAARDPRTVLPKPDLEPEDPMYDGRYDDGLIGDFVDPRSTDAWKRAPFLYGIVEFLFFPSTMLPAVVAAALLIAVICAGQFTLKHALSGDGGAPVVIVHLSSGIEVARSGGGNPAYAVIGLLFFVPLLLIWLTYFSATFFTIARDTGNGSVEVGDWPDWKFYEWFGPTIYVAFALIVSVIPGGLIAAATYLASLSDPMMAAFGIAAPPILSWLILFPFVLHSMLVEDHVMAIASPSVIKTLHNAAEAWLIFYTYSIGITFLLSGALALMAVSQLLIAAVGACATVVVLFLYARLVGRLMWYTSHKDAAPAATAHRQAARG